MNKKCPHNDPYCGDCHNKLDYKTKAEERLIKTIIKHEEANTHAERGISWDKVQNAILKVLVERKKA
jgi:hypothetical protein